jgi:hypothetical protein
MAKKENSAPANNKEERARAGVRRVLKKAALTREGVAKHDREGWERFVRDIADTANPECERVKRVENELAAGLDRDGADEFYRAYCAVRIERALPPSPWRDYALRDLRRYVPTQARRGGIEVRNQWIFYAALWATYCGLKPTRSPAGRYKGSSHSACSLVAEGLKEIGLSLSEDAVKKIWDKQLKMARQEAITKPLISDLMEKWDRDRAPRDKSLEK